jgi:hypothetical protein
MYVVCVKPCGLRTWLVYTQHETIDEATEQAEYLTAMGMPVPGAGRVKMPVKTFKR